MISLPFAVAQSSCHLTREPNLSVRKCPCICGVAPRYQRGNLWRICIISQPNPSFRSNAPSLFLWEFFYFFEVRHCESMPNFVHARISYLTALAPVIMCGALTCWRSVESGKARQTTVRKFPSPTIMVCHNLLIYFNFI